MDERSSTRADAFLLARDTVMKYADGVERSVRASQVRVYERARDEC